jgi:ethanolamine utilization protein EutA
MPDSPQDERKTPHSVADHRYGALSAHEHGEGAFDHDHDEDFLPLGSKSLESVPLISLGLDVGSSGTQVIFTRLEMRGPGEHRALRRQAKARETLYMSPVALTPLRDDDLIDEDKLWAIVSRAFEAAGLTPDDIETGVVILTGAAAARANAQAIAQRVAEEVGELVCAAAGDHMEAMLSAWGSGAVAASAQGAGRRILNIDIGGATTKFAVADHGRVIMTAALRIGGRLMAVDLSNTIVRLDPAGARHAAHCGLDWRKGDSARPEDMSSVAQSMARALVAALVERPMPAAVAALFVTEPIGDFGPIDEVMVSGGVAEYVYGREKRDFGDLGWRLGRAFRKLLDEGALPWRLAPAGECIRATALGASEHSVQISGQTIHISDHAALLPRRNLQVVQPDFVFGETVEAGAVARAIRQHRAALGLDAPASDFALAFRWRGSPDYARLRGFAEGVLEGMADLIAAGAPLYLMLEGDAAQSLGAILREDLGLRNDLLLIDAISLRDFDYVDIGRVRLPSNTVPVTIKTLLFGAPVK